MDKEDRISKEELHDYMKKHNLDTRKVVDGFIAGINNLIKEYSDRLSGN